MIRVRSVAPDSLGRELGIVPGTELLRIDDRELADFLDWEFLTAEDQFLLVTRTPEGHTVEYDIERPEGLSMGIELDPPRIRRCPNRCDFCFVDGNPHGMREVLYIRDDDYRLSFRHGNFATLTNLKEHDIERIIEYRLSPLYVSVHATDEVVRRRLLRNPLAPDIKRQLVSFGEQGIEFHTQIVLQPEVNDRAVLAQSLNDLYTLGSTVLSVSVVPVGLTEYSKHTLVRELTGPECAAAVAEVDRIGATALAERGFHWAYGSDDLYLGAAIDLPPESRYDDFEQVENGVGSVRFLQRAVSRLECDLSAHRVGVVTGTAMGRLMPQVLEPLTAKTGGDFELIIVENRLFGPSVTTAGLLPGDSIQRAIAERTDLDLVLLPGEAINDDGLFVDDMSSHDLVQASPIPMRFSHSFADALSEAGS